MALVPTGLVPGRSVLTKLEPDRSTLRIQASLTKWSVAVIAFTSPVNLPVEDHVVDEIYVVFQLVNSPAQFVVVLLQLQRHALKLENQLTCRDAV